MGLSISSSPQADCEQGGKRNLTLTSTQCFPGHANESSRMEVGSSKLAVSSLMRALRLYTNQWISRDLHEGGRGEEMNDSVGDHPLPGLTVHRMGSGILTLTSTWCFPGHADESSAA
jgi:hypothetical protein